MKAIVAVDKNWAIGYQGRLLVSIRADQQNFKNWKNYRIWKENS